MLVGARWKPTLDPATMIQMDDLGRGETIHGAGRTVLVAESAGGRDRNIISSQLGASLTSSASVTLCWA